MRKRITIGLAALATAGAVGWIGLNHTASGDTENCASHTEYDRLEVLWSPAHVESVFDVNGVYGDGGENTFVRKYRTCWDPDGTIIKIWYDNDSGLSLRWDTRAV